MIGIETVAWHEAGHAVMRWLSGWPATALIANEDGSGFCAGTGRRVGVSDHLRVMLAGPAAETGCGINRLDWTGTHFQDFDEARHLLARCVWLVPPAMDVEEALRVHFDAVCRQLWDFWDLLEVIAERLSWDGRLSARSVAAVCREHGRRIEKSTDRHQEED